jgi:uncharacterized membrane protein
MSQHAAAYDIIATYKRVFLRGLATVLPTVLTLWIVLATYAFVDVSIAGPISGSIKAQLVETPRGNELVFGVWENLAFLRRATPAPPPASLSAAEQALHWQRELERIEALEPQRRADLRRELDLRFPKWVGFVLAVVAVFVVGFFMASFLGSWLWGMGESWAVRIPLVKSIYPGAKQLVNFFFSDGGATFQAVVAVEFPRTGLWSIGFLTSENVGEVEAKAGERVRGVYLGTPAAGQVVLARESEIVPVDMTVDEALKFLMSGGVIGRDPSRPPQAPRLPWDPPA